MYFFRIFFYVNNNGRMFMFVCSYWIRWCIENIWRVVGVNCGLDGLFLAEGIWKVHIFSNLFVCFETSGYTLGKYHKNRNNSTVFEELWCQLWIWRSQISILLAPLRVASNTAFATVKSTIDTSNSSITVLLFLKVIWNEFLVK